MKTNRIGYILLICILAIMFFLSGRPFLLYALSMLTIIAVIESLLLLMDCRHISIELELSNVSQFGKELPYTWHIKSKRKLLVTRGIFINFEIDNKMFGNKIEKNIFFEMQDSQKECVINLAAEQCGEIKFKCSSVYIMDLLGILKIGVKGFDDVSTVIYPKHMNISVELSDTVRGESMTEGEMQNRKGNDRSEIYDIREYQQGDDIRSIHWKLSSKIDKLIVREASEPSYYDVAIIPDLGHFIDDKEVSIDELNTAVAVTAVVAEQLLNKGAHFGVMIPTENGLDRIDINTEQDYGRMIIQSMSYKILDKAGYGLKYFISERREKYFTRLVIVSAGRYSQNLVGLDKQMGITIINVVEDRKKMYMDSREDFDIIEIPAKDTENSKYHIMC